MSICVDYSNYTSISSIKLDVSTMPTYCKAYAHLTLFPSQRHIVHIHGGQTGAASIEHAEVHVNSLPAHIGDIEGIALPGSAIAQTNR
jgi:hypothetical protein